MRRGERPTDLLDDADRAAVVRGPASTALAEAAVLEATHHEVGRVGFTPVVEDRHDLRVFELGDRLRLALEPADEVGSLASSGRITLIATSRPTAGWKARYTLPSAPVTDLARAARTPDRQSRFGAVRRARGRPRTRASVGSSSTIRSSSLDSSGRRVEPEFLAQPRAQRAERTQRITLATGPVERQHQVTGQPLAERVLADQALELTDQLPGPPGAQIGVDPIFDRRQAELVQSGDLGRRRTTRT